MVEAQHFQVVLEGDPNSDVTGITIPFDVYAAFGTRARCPVRGTINGYPYRSSIFPEGGGKFYMVVNKEMRAGAGVRADDLMDKTMEPDTATRVITPPADFAAALAASPAAQATWTRLSFSHQREYVGPIEDAKKPETRQRRIARAMERLAAGLKAR
jgi:hypothetical protein